MKEGNFKLTESQELLKIKLQKFLQGSERIFRLIGKPGVGKTTMTKICLEDLITADIESHSKGLSIQVAGITLSHQAKNVLGEFIPNVFTFAKAYGMKEVIHLDGSRTFEYDRNADKAPVGEYPIPVFVHDEVSQYTESMLKIVLEKTPIFSKIILMGDKAQLPPIDPNNVMGVDADSPVFDIELLDECQHELTERVRQAKGNPILELSDVIREEIFGNQDINRVLKIIATPKMKDNVGYSFIGYGDLNEHLKDRNLLDLRLIAFRNKTVQWFNSDIRSFLLDNPKDEIIENDIICMLDNYYHEENGDINYVLYNSDIFKLGKVYTRFIRFSDGHRIHKIEVYIGQIVGQKYKELIYPTKKGKAELEVSFKEIMDKCKRRKMKWEIFYNLKKMFCNCTYGYAVTAYKAQGSTYDTVYVDLNDVLMTKPITPKRKLQTIYTAITRAKYDVYFLKYKI